MRKWVKAHLEQSQVPMADAATAKVPAVAATFVPVTVQASPVESPADIRVEIRRAEIQIAWPMSQSSLCAQWLRELLA